MKNTRRSLLQLSAMSSLLALPCLNLQAASAPRKLGLIFPPADRVDPPEEGVAMYGDSITYLIEALGLETMTPEGYDAVQDRIRPAGERLAERGAEAVILMGTSLSFYKGEAYNQQLTQLLRDATGGLPVTTMSTAVINGLKGVGAKRMAVATAYNDEVNDRLRTFLGEHGLDVLAIEGLGIEAVEDIFSVTQPQLIEFGSRVSASAPDANALLVSCGGLRTLEILEPLEQRTGLPTISSTPHAMYAANALLGMDLRWPHYGQLMGM